MNDCQIPSKIILGIGGRGCNFILQCCFELEAKLACQIYMMDQNKIYQFSPETQWIIEQNSKIFFNNLRVANQVAIITGLGGNTGGLTTPLMCSFLAEHKIRTTVIATLPFLLEGASRRNKGFMQLQEIEKRCMNNDTQVFHYENPNLNERDIVTISKYFTQDNKMVLSSLLTILNKKNKKTNL